jgi:UDP-glucose 4-epimerase
MRILVTGRTIPVRYGQRRPGDPPALVASHERAERELGWRLRCPDLRQMVETAWNWHRNHPYGYRQRPKE